MCDYLHWNEGISWWFSGWESACQCRGHGFDPWLGKIPYAMGQLSLSATTTMPMHLEPCSTTREASAMNSLCTAMKSSPHSLPREKAQAEQRRPSTAKNNKYIIKNKFKWNKAKDSVLLSHQSHFRWLTYWTVQMLDISITVESSTRKRRFRMFTCHIHHPGPWGWSLCTDLTSKPPHLTLGMILSWYMHQYSSSGWENIGMNTSALADKWLMFQLPAPCQTSGQAWLPADTL